MKKTRLLFLMLLLVVSIGMQAQSGTCEANGVTWTFYVSGSQATITGETQGKNAFHGELNIPAMVQLSGQSYTVAQISYSAFRGYQGATSITIPDNIIVADYAFQDCRNAESLTLGNNVRAGGYGCFVACSKLNSTNIHYPSGELKNIIETGLLVGLSWITGNFEIPAGITKIGSSCFSGCTELTSVTIPDGVTAIGDYAFQNCTSLSSVTIPDGVTAIGASAFSGCSSLSSVTIPDGVTTIAYNTFYKCI